MAQKVTLITGCSTGIGLTMAVKFAKDSAKKYIVYSTMRNLGKSQELEAAAGDALKDTMQIRPLDVISDDSVSNAVKEIVDEHGRIDVLINNAGIATFNPAEFTPLQDIREVMETNFFGTVRMIQNVLPIMKERKSGHIINIGSIGGVLGFPFYDTYCASKCAIEGLTEAMAIRMKAFDVKITNVNPGPVDSNINDNIVENNRLPEMKKIDRITKHQLLTLATHQKDHFMNRTQTAEEIAEIVQSIVEMPDVVNRPVRFMTSDYWSERASLKYCDIGAKAWTDYIRYLITDPAENQTEAKSNRE